MDTRAILDSDELVAGRYRVVRQLGMGGMGRVFEADDEGGVKRKVALKMLRPSQLNAPELDDESRMYRLRRFLNEASAAARVASPHVVTIYDVVDHNGYYFIVQEFIPGSLSLQDAMWQAYQDGEWLDEITVCEHLHQAALGLKAAHAVGVVHRDIKPANMLLSRGSDDIERLSLIDFGIAVIENSERLTLTGHRTILGTPGYIAPEVILGEGVPAAKDDPGAPDHRVDFFSLGVSIYFALTYQLPFARYETAEDMAHALSAPPPSPEDLRPGISEHWEVVLHKLFAPYRDLRYENAQQLVRDTKLLQTLLENEEHPETEPPLPPRFGSENSDAPSRPAGAESLSDRALARARTLEAIATTFKRQEQEPRPTLTEATSHGSHTPRKRRSPRRQQEAAFEALPQSLTPDSNPATPPEVQTIVQRSVLGPHMLNPNIAHSAVCTMPYKLVTDGVHLEVIHGRVDLDFAHSYAAATEASFAASTKKLQVFSDWSHVTGYSSEARSFLTSWGLGVRQKYEVAHLLVTLPFVAMGLSVANLAVKFFYIHKTPETFRESFAQTLGR